MKGSIFPDHSHSTLHWTLSFHWSWCNPQGISPRGPHLPTWESHPACSESQFILCARRLPIPVLRGPWAVAARVVLWGHPIISWSQPLGAPGALWSSVSWQGCYPASSPITLDMPS